MPPWSRGQDVALSRRNQGFDSLWRYHNDMLYYLIILNLPQISPLHALVLTIILSMTLSMASGETLEWREMIINKIWTSLRTSIFVKCFICYFCTLKFFPPCLSHLVFENMNLLSYTQPKKRISVFTSDHAVIVDIITMCIGTLATRT